MAWNYGDLFDALDQQVPADHTALIHGGNTVSWHELGQRSNRIGRFLLQQGLQTGDKVALYMRNQPAYLETLIGCFKSRLVHVNVNYRYKAQELLYLLDNADAKAVIFDAEFAPLVSEIRAQLPLVTTWIEVPADNKATNSDTINYRAISTTGTAQPLSLQRSPDDYFFIYTGGTTGMPKGVMWRQQSLMQLQLIFSCGLEGLPMPSNTSEFIDQLAPHNLSTRQLIAAPLMHTTGLIGALGVLMKGGSVITLPEHNFCPQSVWQAVQRYRASGITLVGDAFANPLLNDLQQHPDRYDLSSLQTIVSSGVIWSAANKRGLLQHLPSLTLVDGLGSTEAPGCGLSIDTRDTTSGPPTFQVSEHCRVFTADGREVLPGEPEPGYLALCGHIPSGYYKDEKKTRETFRHFNGMDCALTGDFCRVADDGTLIFLGRGSQCINTGGEKVFTEEVEAALINCPQVSDAIVIGVPDPQWGETVVATVAPATGHTPSEADLKNRVREQLANYKVPKAIFFKPQLARHPNGKPDYQAARDYAASCMNSDTQMEC